MIWNLIRPLLFALPPETVHNLVFNLIEATQTVEWLQKIIHRVYIVEEQCLKTNVLGLEFPNPIGLAAGLDKNARLLPFWHSLGFGFVEVGTITPLPQQGNPSPRLFRLPTDEALINRMGFNNEGEKVIRERLVSLLRKGKWPSFPVGINLGKGKGTPLEKAKEDYLTLLDDFLDLGDYFVVNVSSPNTPGLRRLQEKSRLNDLLAAAQARNQTRCRPHVRPLLLKVDPDLEWSILDEVLELCIKHRLAGIIATNTTLSREGLRTTKTESGGLSGRPLCKRSLEVIRYIYRAHKGQLPIIGVGGIFTAEDAYAKIRAGASLVQAYTGFVYRGPALACEINRGLIRLLKRDGISKISEAVGKDVF